MAISVSMPSAIHAHKQVIPRQQRTLCFTDQVPLKTCFIQVHRTLFPLKELLLIYVSKGRAQHG